MNGVAEGNGHEAEIVYAFDLPGIPEAKISLELDEGSLTVTAERERTDAVEDGR
ncbi:MAG: Hsp20/alpha crystallin family protein [Gaiellaceae bacterium]